MPTAIQALEILADELPEVFEHRELPRDWLEDWVVVPVNDPDKASGEASDEWLDLPFEEVRTNLPIAAPDFPWIEGAESLSGQLGSGGGVHGGGLLLPTQVPGGKSVGGHPPSLPPDCLAFYLPIHYYFPHWWGIYLLADGVEYFAREIDRRHTSGIPRILTPRECREAARIYLYWHEHYHHQVEAGSIRLEVTHRHTLYRFGFHDLYRRTFRTPDCLEETMAEVRAYQKTLSAFAPKPSMKKREKARQARKCKALGRALLSLIKTSPPGYREAAAVIRRGRVEENHHELIERCHVASLPKAPRLSPAIWGNSPHLLHGFSNIRSRVNYLIPKGSPMAGRIPLDVHPRIGTRDLVKGLQKLNPDLEVIPAKGRHPLKLKAPGGRAIPIPVHPRDLSTGTLAKIIKQAGLDMGLRQFMAAI